MPTDTASFLTLAQWLSPAYPVGAFSYSHGLETAVADGRVGDGETLHEWIDAVLTFGSGRSDALFLAAAWNAADADELAALDRTCRAFAPSCERLKETTLQGAAFAQTTAQVWDVDLPKLCYPIAVGRAARLQDIPAVTASAMFLHAFVGNLVSVAMRLLPLGQTAGQAVICGLAPLCATIAGETAHGDLSQLSGTAFLADIAAMRHQSQATRIFRT